MEALPDSFMTYHRTHDGVQLAVEVFSGQENMPKLLFLHGFGQNRLAWHASAISLSRAGFTCWTMDGRGHGDSGWSADADYALEQFTADALAVLAQLQGESIAPAPIVVGASMGGLLGLLCAAQSPATVRALALIDVTPRWETAGVERIFAFMRANPNGFADLTEANDAVLAYQPQREPGHPNRLRAHLREGSDGRLRWHWDPLLLPKITEAAKTYTPILELAAASVNCPVLLLSGGRSDVVSSATIQSFMKQVPHAQHRQIADATHRVVGDSNQPFTDAMLDFLTQFIPQNPSSNSHPNINPNLNFAPTRNAS